MLQIGLPTPIDHRVGHYLNSEELEHFRCLLLRMRNEAIQAIGLGRDELALTEVVGDEVDRAVTEGVFGAAVKIIERHTRLIEQVDRALARLEDGSYGYCQESGEPIGLQRLLAQPLATLSVEAQEIHERWLGRRTQG